MNDERLSLEITLRFIFKIIKQNLSNKIAIVFYLIFPLVASKLLLIYFRKFSNPSKYSLLGTGTLYILYTLYNIQYITSNRYVIHPFRMKLTCNSL